MSTKPFPEGFTLSAGPDLDVLYKWLRELATAGFYTVEVRMSDGEQFTVTLYGWDKVDDQFVLEGRRWHPGAGEHDPYWPVVLPLWSEDRPYVEGLHVY